MIDLSGKKALVTGSTQGIGFAIAARLAKCGATVVVHGSRSMEKCQKAAARIEGNTLCAVADLMERDCEQTLYRQTGDVDILILNASVQIRKAWDEITDDEFEQQINVNLKASLHLIQRYTPHMAEQQWGRIITVGSVQQTKPHKDMLVYAASKCAQMSMVQNLSKQLAPSRITVNNLSPGVIATPRNKEALSNPAYNRKVLSAVPLGFAGTADDCAGAALLLSTEDGRYITGIDLVVDGGMHL